jgi:uncharacterized protein (DUF433 family)
MDPGCPVKWTSQRNRQKSILERPQKGLQAGTVRTAFGETMQDQGYVTVDSSGVMRVGSTRVMLDSIVAAFDEGHSAETIQQQYPALGLDAVYGAIAYYLSHVHEVKESLQRQGALWDKLRKESDLRPGPVLRRWCEWRGTGAPQGS